jgi:hypothetical protein
VVATNRGMMKLSLLVRISRLIGDRTRYSEAARFYCIYSVNVETFLNYGWGLNYGAGVACKFSQTTYGKRFCYSQ